MTPEQTKQFYDLLESFNKLHDLFYRTNGVDRVIHMNPVYFNGKVYFENTTLATGTKTGSSFGSSPTDKLSFYGATPIIQQSAIVPPSGGGTIDSQARTAIGTIITALKNLGLTA